MTGQAINGKIKLNVSKVSKVIVRLMLLDGSHVPYETACTRCLTNFFRKSSAIFKFNCPQAALKTTWGNWNTLNF